MMTDSSQSIPSRFMIEYTNACRRTIQKHLARAGPKGCLVTVGNIAKAAFTEMQRPWKPNRGNCPYVHIVAQIIKDEFSGKLCDRARSDHRYRTKKPGKWVTIQTRSGDIYLVKP